MAKWFTYMCAKSLQLCLTPCDPMDVAHQAPLSMGFSRQEYWSVAMPSSRGYSRPRDRTHVFHVSCIERWILYQ